MINESVIHLRCYEVTILDMRTNETKTDSIIIDKQALQAAQIIGLSSDNVIKKYYSKKGYRVIKTGVPVKKSVTVDFKSMINSPELEVSNE